MGVNILYGESRADLTRACLEQVFRFRGANPNRRAVLVVPETSKMDMEYELLTGADREGMMLTEVLSFSRFCHRVLGEIGAGADPLIDEAGKSVLLYRVLKENESRLDLFRNLCRKPGLMGEILSVMGDLKRVLVDAPMLRGASSDLSDRILAKKAGELAILMEEYDRTLKNSSLLDPQDHYTRTAKQLEIFAAKRALSADGGLPWPYDRLEWLSGAGVWILGFGETRDFTPQEYALIDALDRCCAELTVTLAYDGTEAFFRAGAQSISHFRKKGLPNLAFRRVPPGPPTFFGGLAASWKKQTAAGDLVPDPIPQGAAFSSDPREPAFEGNPTCGQITLVHCSSKRQETALLAGEIRRLIREEGIRCRDILVAAPGLESYEAVIRATFREAGIPYYLDGKLSLGRTSLARMVGSLLDLCLYGWSQNALMNYARCGFCDASREELDEFETFMLARGIRWKSQLFDSARFDAPEPSDSVRDPEGETVEETEEGLREKSEDSLPLRMIALRDRLCKTILDLEKNIKKSASGRQFCESLRGFLEAEAVEQKIGRMRDVLLQQPQEDAATALVKAWNELLHLLEEIEQICADIPMDLELFRGILRSGMEKAVSGTIPSSVDQVRFAPIGQTGGRPRRVLYIIGLCDGAYPEKLPAEGILKDREREAFSEYFGIRIPSVVSDKYDEDLFRTYDLLGSAKEKLYLSCPQPRENESPLLSFVRENVPECRSMEWSEFPGPFDPQIYSRRTALHELVSRMDERPDGERAQEWTALYGALVRRPEYRSGLLSLKNRPKSSREPIRLAGETILERYGDPVAMSVSQLETYSACAYSHYAKYLLKLLPRAAWDPQSSDTGSLLHGIVEIAVREFLCDFASAGDAKEKELLLEKYRSMDFEVFAFEKMKEAVRRDGRYVFLDRGVFASKGRTSCRLAAATLQAVFDQFDARGFIPAVLEWEFSRQNSNALSLSPAGRPPVLFSGKVDRIDKDGSYFRVIDYKSSGKTVDFDKWYHGLSLQLPAYVAAFSRNHPDSVPADVSYMHFDRPVIFYENGAAAQIAQKHSQNLKRHSQLRKTGLGPEGLSAAARHTVRKMERLSALLLDGKYGVTPKKSGGKVPCEYCEYMSVCGFESKYDVPEYCEPLERQKDAQGKSLPKAEAFLKKIAGEESP